jgi:hypothetical protein
VDIIQIDIVDSQHLQALRTSGSRIFGRAVDFVRGAAFDEAEFGR